MTPDPAVAAPDRVRDAATVILVRDTPDGPSILMGQRGAGAVFMPNKYVFPGGALDPVDADTPFARPLAPCCLDRLARNAPPGLGPALAASAIRELWEETGLLLGRPGLWPSAPAEGWRDFAATGLLPDAAPLSFVFRAITPPGRTRRFDARFFLADARHLVGDPDDFSRASDELGHLHWVPLRDARALNLPFITEV
ncbi:MAG: NUDIX hydrolase, partial [Rhodobacteraceae bacterium]|nr:NUDIX hydrolase [Paracoccaceae bacterium]